jgi:hypothetical protein
VCCNFAHFVLPQEQFDKVTVPEHSVFWKGFDLLTKQCNFSKGNLMLKLDGDLKLVNRLFNE